MFSCMDSVDPFCFIDPVDIIDPVDVAFVLIADCMDPLYPCNRIDHPHCRNIVGQYDHTDYVGKIPLLVLIVWIQWMYTIISILWVI